MNAITNESLVEQLNERSRMIVELLQIIRFGQMGAVGDIHIRRARRIIDGDRDARVRGEADYQAYCAASPDHEHEGTREDLELTLRMLEEYGPDALPANENGQVPFARAMIDAAAGSIRAYLSVEATDQPASPSDGVVEALRADAFEEAAKIALSHSNYGRIEGNERAFRIEADISRRAKSIRAALQSGESSHVG